MTIFGFPEPDAAKGGGHVIGDALTTYPQRGTLKFLGAAVTDDVPNAATVVSIPPSLIVSEVDGSPIVSSVSQIKFPNGSIIDHGGGIVELSALLGVKSIQTRTLINDMTLISDGEWDFVGIPSGYDYLEIEFIGQGNTGAYGENVRLFYNGDTNTSNYYRRSVGAVSGTVSADAANDCQIASISTIDSGAGVVSSFIARIYNYASSIYQTHCQNDSALRRSDVGHQGYTYYMWWNSTVAVTRIQIKPQYISTFKSGSRVKLWGVKYDSIGGSGDHTHSADQITSGVFDAARIPDLSALYAAASHNHAASAITSGTLALARGGSGADLSATGGANQFLKQSSAGAALSVASITSDDLTAALTTPPVIGETTPAAGYFSPSITLNASSGNTQVNMRNSSGVSTTQFQGFSSGALESATGDAKTLFLLGAGGHNGTDWMGATSARLYFQSLGVYSLTNTGARMIVSTTPQNSNTRYDAFYVEGIGSITSYINDAATNTATSALSLRHRTSASVAAGFGSSIDFLLKTTVNDRNAASIIADWYAHSDSVRAGELGFYAWYTSTQRPLWKGYATSSGIAWAFGSATPTTDQTYGAISGSLSRAAWNTGTVTLATLAQIVAAIQTDLIARKVI